MIDSLLRARAETYSAPRTVLGFFGVVLAILVTAGVPGIAVLAGTESLRYLVPYVLGFIGLFFGGVVISVFVVVLTDPTKLQLGHMTGSEYTEHHRITQGDSASGERIEGSPVLTIETRDKQRSDAGDPGTQLPPGGGNAP